MICQNTAYAVASPAVSEKDDREAGKVVIRLNK